MGARMGLKEKSNPTVKDNMRPKQQVIRRIIRSMSLSDWMYNIDNPANDPSFPASILSMYQPRIMGIPTLSPATIGRCHCLLVLLNLKNESICSFFDLI